MMVCALIVQLVRVDRRRVLPFNVETTILFVCMVELLMMLPNTGPPFNVDTVAVETKREETVMVERVAVLPWSVEKTAGPLTSVEADNVEKKREWDMIVEPTRRFAFRLEPATVEIMSVLP